MSAMIEVRGLTKTYDNGVTALTGIDFTVEQGEKVVLLGHNGSGKSTLFRCVSQFEKPTQGHVYVNGADLPTLSKRTVRGYRKQMGIVFQHFNLVYNVSVLQNVLFGAMGRTATFIHVLAPFAANTLREEAMDCLEQVGLASLAGRRADALSGGQKQRVAIARMLMQRPSIILADEPIASLDPKAGKEIMSLLTRIASKKGMTMICILHQLEAALEFGDRIIALKNGKKVLDASVQKMDQRQLSWLYDVEEKEEEVS
ncbi:phosphonate ABC transporter ATP-binding protein [Alkalihalobacillus sp. LMS6]|uniref:phosphonate ABC transporter ATP-binding protein n=1 Tax=Alkalihalobacillus sp. LMS6 TaxID=2924034 RepID=UPI0020D090B5|nr:phosphonate ABC transporter ATP-binding protein [Alkalihalobacillus sp. LMS6]UTR05957.1 phosphonate ABC transporter ATP-binding protein [Alkalihalobacillus sp. LMS6]